MLYESELTICTRVVNAPLSCVVGPLATRSLLQWTRSVLHSPAFPLDRFGGAATGCTVIGQTGGQSILLYADWPRTVSRVGAVKRESSPSLFSQP